MQEKHKAETRWQDANDYFYFQRRILVYSAIILPK